MSVSENTPQMYPPVPFIRAEHLKRLQHEEFDVVIIGGGATGAGAALEAVTKGLKTALIERYDFSSGTSSRSTKLLHGGVRYLEKAAKQLDLAQFNLVREALHERGVVLKLAPHLSRTCELLLPLKALWEVPYFMAGLTAYDLLSGRQRIGKSVYRSKRAIHKLLPGLDTTRFKGAVSYRDGQFDDARLNVELVMTASQKGACIANYLQVMSLQKEDGKVQGVRVRDSRAESSEFLVRGKVVINATGPYVDAIRRMDVPDARTLIRPSSGIHILVDRNLTPTDVGMLVPKTKDGRVLFMLPFYGKTMIGTTDEQAPLSDDPKASRREVEYVLEEINRYLDEPLRFDDITATWSGLRPLVTGEGSTENLVREHYIEIAASGLVTITGGKWTTYRSMAEEVIRKAAASAGLPISTRVSTTEVPLLGSEGFSPSLASLLEQQFALTSSDARWLVDLFGGRARVIAAELSRYGESVESTHDALLCAITWYVARFEAATSIDDVLARRTRVLFVDEKRAIKLVPLVAGVLHEVLGGSDDYWQNCQSATLQDYEARAIG